MSIIETISLWGGFAGVVLAIITIVILILVRNNIAFVLDRDSIIFEQNFEMKKTTVENSINLVDYLLELGVDVISNKAFKTKCKSAYNEMLCLINNSKLIDTFYDLCLNDSRTAVDAEEIADYKTMCRKELGYRQIPSSYFGSFRDLKRTKKEKKIKLDEDKI